MAIKSSEFYKKLETLETARQTGIDNLRAKGLDVSDLASIPNIVDKINNIQTDISTTILQTTGNKVIYAADLPDTYIYLIKDGVILEKKKTPDVTGGIVSFVVEDDGEYFIGTSKEDFDSVFVDTEFTFEQLANNGPIDEFRLNNGVISTHNNTSSPNGYSVCKLSFNVSEDNGVLCLDVPEQTQIFINYSGNRLVFSTIDKILRSENYTSNDTNAGALYVEGVYVGKKVIYENIPKGEHFITIKYISSLNNTSPEYRVGCRIVPLQVSNMPMKKIIVKGNGEYVCNGIKGLNSYTWEEIEHISNNHYGQYVFEFGDSKQISFMSSNDTCAYFVGSEKIEGIDGNTLNMTFCIKYTGEYRGVTNEGSWVSSVVRTNCLESGDIQYKWNSSVTSSTSGLYYVWDNYNKIFVQKTLPDEYVATEKYFTQNVVEEDGVFIKSLKQNLGNVSPKICVIKTWGGYGGAVTNISKALTDDTQILTQDKLWVVSDADVNNDGFIARYTTSRQELEGIQLDAFKDQKQYVLVKYASGTYLSRSPSIYSKDYLVTLSYQTGVPSRDSETNARQLGPLCFSL